MCDFVIFLAAAEQKILTKYDENLKLLAVESYKTAPKVLYNTNKHSKPACNNYDYKIHISNYQTG